MAPSQFQAVPISLAGPSAITLHALSICRQF